MAISDSSPPSLCSSIRRDLQRLVLSDGTFFPSRRRNVLWGRASAPASVDRKALGKCVHSCKFFCVEWPVREAFLSARLGIISAGLDNVTHAYWCMLTIGYVRKV
jgi:hypothetical protein